jgi:hypothetical protein
MQRLDGKFVGRIEGRLRGDEDPGADARVGDTKVDGAKGRDGANWQGDSECEQGEFANRSS